MDLDRINYSRGDYTIDYDVYFFIPKYPILIQIINHKDLYGQHSY